MLDRTLTAARLRATVPTVDIISNTEVLVEVDLTWTTGTGEASPPRRNVGFWRSI